jgi:hypothetical protein
MIGKLYDDFSNVEKEFANEPRAFCYEVASDFVARAKKRSKDDWLSDNDTVKGVLLLLFTWNFAAKATKRLSFATVGAALTQVKADLHILEHYSITAFPESASKPIERVFETFTALCGQTGASKALSLLNPQLFVMWDTKIRQRLCKELIPGIGNGQTGQEYVVFLKGVRRIINDHEMLKKVPADCIAKKLDEYNYVRIVMPRNRARGSAASKPSADHAA